MRPIRVCAVAVLVTGSLLACRKETEIRRYAAPKDPATSLHDEAQVEAQSILAGMVPVGDTVWFVKVSGPASRVASERAAFVAFMTSLHFHESKVDWTIPADWKQVEAPASTEAKFLIGPAQATLTVLPKREGYVLMNVNRWRGQLGMAPVTEQDLAGVVHEIETQSGKGGWVHFEAGGAAHDPHHPPAVRTTPKLRYEVPPGWTEATAAPPRAALFSAGGEGGKAEISVTPLGPEAGKLVPNVNRWRGQVGLPPASPEEIQRQAREVAIAGAKGTLVEIFGAESGPSIIAALVERDGRVWFFKIMGPAPLVRREAESFGKFLASVTFDEPR